MKGRNRRRTPRLGRFLLRAEQLEARQLLTTFLVTGAGDNGNNASPIPGSLRDAILRSDASPAPSGHQNEIDFDIAGPSTIAPTGTLPTITAPVVIDGRTQPNAPVVLDGINLDLPGHVDNGLRVDASNSTFEGLTIDRFPGAGLLLSGLAKGDQVFDDRLGTDPTGESSLGNGFAGIFLLGSSNNTIQGCVISGNAGNGIDAMGAQAYGNLIIGNEIGTDAAGSKALRNASIPGQPGTTGNGIFLDAAPANIVGGAGGGDANIISGNEGDGIRMNGPGAIEDQVRDNKIGTNSTATHALGNAIGVAIVQGSASTPAGSGNVISGNTISGNVGDGVMIQGSSNSVDSNTIAVNGGNGVEVTGSGSGSTAIRSNFIGTDFRGSAALGNASNGILIESSPGVLVVDNDIAGSRAGDGVDVEGADHATITGNDIGVDPSGTKALGDKLDGVLLENAQNASVTGNVLSGNGSFGLEVKGSSVIDTGPIEVGQTGLIVERNSVGTDHTGTRAIANAGGISITGAGVVPSGISMRDNTVSGNEGVGVQLSGVFGANLQGNRIGTTAAGTAALANSGDGLDVTGSYFVQVSYNVIAGNGQIGLNATNDLFLGVDGNHVGVGNDPGTFDGRIALGNAGGGVRLTNVSGTIQGNTISANGTAPLPIIHATSSFGLDIVSVNFSVPPPVAFPLGIPVAYDAITGPVMTIINPLQVLDNLIGTDATGRLGRGNLGDGIQIGATAGVTVRGNILSANTGNGLIATGSTGPQIDNNTIGTGVTGTESLGNGADGIELTGTGEASVVGNVIVMNANGIGVAASPSSLVLNAYLALNFIGTRPLGPGRGFAAGLGNQDFGILIVSGSAVTVIKDVIDSNGLSGIGAYGAAGQGAGLTVQGNFIGTSPDHAANLGNGSDGIFLLNIDGASIVGNAIGANGGDGVNATVSQHVDIRGNFIGTDADGQATSLGNRGDGIRFAFIVVDPLVGSPVDDPTPATADDYVTRNTIVNNSLNGIELSGLARLVTFSQNQIGGNLPVAGSSRMVPSGNAKDGILIAATAPSSGIYVSSSLIAGNGLDGVHLAGAGQVTLGSHNTIAYNLGNGVVLDSGSTGNILSNDLIGGNGGDGVQVDQSPNNTLSGVVIEGNLGKGLRINQSTGIVVKGGQIAGNTGG